MKVTCSRFSVWYLTWIWKNNSRLWRNKLLNIVQIHALMRWLRLLSPWTKTHLFRLFKLKNVKWLVIWRNLLISGVFPHRLLLLLVLLNNLILVLIMPIFVGFSLIVTPFYIIWVVDIILVTHSVCLNLVASRWNVSSSMVNDKLKLLTHLNLNVCFKAFVGIIIEASCFDAPRVVLSILTENLNILSSPYFFVITWSRLQVNSSFKYAHSSISFDLSEHPKSPYSFGHHHSCSHRILLNSLFDCFFHFFIHH